MRCTLIAAMSLVLAAQVQAAERSAAQLTVEARHIFAKYCLDCHGEKSSKSSLKVLDHVQMTQESPVVRFIDPTGISASQALELIEEGSMPPGSRAKVTSDEIATLKAWAAKGAAPYPIQFDDEFAYKTILADVNKTLPAKVPMARYLTLHHLAGDPNRLAQKRAEFLGNTGLPSLLVPGAPEARALDPTETVFRIDLDKAGWNIKPFKVLNKGMVGNPPVAVNANLFDLVLLEYPDTVIPTRSQSFDQLVEKFLRPAQQVRPAVFVRGDWFVAIAGSSPLADDLQELMQPHKRLPDGLVKPRPAGEVPSASAAPTDGIRLPALDARYAPDPPDGKGSVAGFTVDTRDKNGAKQTLFKPGQRFQFQFEARDEEYFLQFVYFNTDKCIEDQSGVERMKGGKPELSKDLPSQGPFADCPGDESVTVLASPHKFPAAVTWGTPDTRTRHVQRFVHPFFEIVNDGNRYVVDTKDARIARRTVKITIGKKDD